MASSVAASKILDEREEKLSTLTKPKLHIAGFDFSELAKLFLKDEANSGRGEDPRSVGGAGPPPPPPAPEREARQGSQSGKPILGWFEKVLDNEDDDMLCIKKWIMPQEGKAPNIFFK